MIDIVEPAAGDSQKESIEQQQWLNSFNEENYYLYQRQNNDDDYDFKDTWNINTDEGETLADYLWSQLISEDFSEQETEIIHFCLDSLDNRGYLTETQEDIAAYFKTDTETIDRILEELKSLDPAGVCAFNLEECLKLQLERKKNAHTCYGVPDRQSPGYGSEKPDPGHCQSPPSFFRGSSRLLPDHQILKSKTGSIFQQP